MASAAPAHRHRVRGGDPRRRSPSMGKACTTTRARQSVCGGGEARHSVGPRPCDDRLQLANGRRPGRRSPTGVRGPSPATSPLDGSPASAYRRRHPSRRVTSPAAVTRRSQPRPTDANAPHAAQASTVPVIACQPAGRDGWAAWPSDRRRPLPPPPTPPHRPHPQPAGPCDERRSCVRR